MSRESICPICGSSARPDHRAWRLLALDRSPQSRSVMSCNECGLRWLFPYTLPDEYQSLYRKDYYESELGDLSYRSEKQELALCYQLNAQRFRSLGITDRLLDVGCGTGDFLYSAAQAGISGAGIEPSRYAVQEATSRGLQVTLGTLTDLLGKGTSFAAAHCSHVLEHVPDAHDFLNQLHSLLVPGAPIYIEVPIQFDGVLDRIHQLSGRRATYSEHSIHHHYFFTPSALNRLLDTHGFTVASLTTFMPCRRALRKSSWKKWLLQSLLWIADRTLQRGDVISVWARRAE